MHKALIVFYSYSGNTQKTAEVLKQELSSFCEVSMQRLEALDETTSFLGQCARAFTGRQARIKEQGVVFDTAGFDIVALGTPVWAFAMAPAMRTYISKCGGIKGKKVFAFCTYGSGAGKDKCLKEMSSLLEKKGAVMLKPFSVQQGRAADRQTIAGELKKVLPDG